MSWGGFKMTSRIFKDYLKSLFPEFKYTLGIEDKEYEKSITIYNRSGTSGLFFFGSEEDQHSQILPLTLIISISGNYTETEEKAYEVYNSIIYKNEVDFAGFVFSIFPKENRLPVYLGRTDEGTYQFAIDIDLIYNK